ncbi:polyribonucleotide nucleotidyltransferase [Candidatus Sumerlaeota bacterium]|nr:polyribonucleotide nucleotidyltransferase [Candidatus Sumerlaeota bacterium]
MKHTVSIPFGENGDLVLETGQVARQAHGSALARIGNTIVMANAVRSNKQLEGMDFFPLQVDYREKHYAVGRIPGNFFRREGRPGTPETINARLVDRSIRPLFPKGFRYEVQVYLTVLSMDQINPPAVPALIAASAALSMSDIPFNGPVGAVRVGYIDGHYVFNPTFPQRDQSALDLVVTGTSSAINMVESGSKGLSEQVILGALNVAQEQTAKVVAGIEELVRLCGKEKIAFEESVVDADVAAAVKETASPRLADAIRIQEKKEREDAVDALREEVVVQIVERFAPAEGEESNAPQVRKQAVEAYDDTFKKAVREMILSTGVRADGRGAKDIRPITSDIGFLPMAHGSAVFTRGQTQSLGVTTLGTVGDQQKIDDLMGISTERFLLHYNFPSYCVGETRRIMGPGRRELGHGMLAQKALEPILPGADTFPYTVRIVSEILESNGSSSMASVCSGCLSLMDAGVPISSPVAGIAMGLIKDGDRVAVLSDIMGMEDHLGDMDFKVAGTREGITALQMDIKISGIGFDVLEQALAQALEGRCHILDCMAEALPAPRPELSPLAPRIEIMKIDPQRIGDLIGPSGKHIRNIVETTGAQIDVEDDGTVFIATNDGEAMANARQMVLDLTADVELHKIYTGKVVRITDFGAFVEILPKKDGLVHVSELDTSRVEAVTDICRQGDMMKVKVIGIDPDSGKVRLSRKQAIMQEQGIDMTELENENVFARKTEGGRGSGRERGGGRQHDRDRGSGGRDRGGRYQDRDRGGRDRGGREGGR